MCKKRWWRRSNTVFDTVRQGRQAKRRMAESNFAAATSRPSSATAANDAVKAKQEGRLNRDHAEGKHGNRSSEQKKQSRLIRRKRAGHLDSLLGTIVWNLRPKPPSSPPLVLLSSQV